jgi:hypothetical protein
MLKITNILPLSDPLEDGVLAEYEIVVESEMDTSTYWAEARECQHTEAQIDWADELSSLLVKLDAPESCHSQISLAVFQEFIGEPLDYPVVLIPST